MKYIEFSDVCKYRKTGENSIAACKPGLEIKTASCARSRDRAARAGLRRSDADNLKAEVTVWSI